MINYKQYRLKINNRIEFQDKHFFYCLLNFLENNKKFEFEIDFKEKIDENDIIFIKQISLKEKIYLLSEDYEQYYFFVDYFIYFIKQKFLENHPKILFYNIDKYWNKDKYKDEKRKLYDYWEDYFNNYEIIFERKLKINKLKEKINI
jgi:hypothetical protein